MATYTDPYRPIVRCTECGQEQSLCSCLAPDELAHRRLRSAEGFSIRAVWDEINRAEERAESNLHLLSRLTAAVGEVNAKILAHDEASREQGTVEPPASAEEIYRALVRVAALSVRLSTEGDEDYAYDPPQVG